MYLHKQSCWRLQRSDLVFLRCTSLINAPPWEWKEIIVLLTTNFNKLQSSRHEKLYSRRGLLQDDYTHAHAHVSGAQTILLDFCDAHTHEGSRHRLSCSNTKLNYSLLSNSTVQGWHGNGNLSTRSATRWHHLPFHFQFRVSFLNCCADSPEGGGPLHAPQTLRWYNVSYWVTSDVF